MMKPAVTLAV